MFRGIIIHPTPMERFIEKIKKFYRWITNKDIVEKAKQEAESIKNLNKIYEQYNDYDYKSDIQAAVNEFKSNISNSLGFEFAGDIMHSKNAFPDLLYRPSLMNVSFFYRGKDIGYYMLTPEHRKNLEKTFKLYEEFCKNKFCKVLKGMPYDSKIKVESYENGIRLDDVEEEENIYMFDEHWLTRQDLIDILNRVDDTYEYRLNTEEERININNYHGRDLYHTGYDNRIFPHMHFEAKRPGDDNPPLFLSSSQYLNLDPKKEFKDGICHYIIAEKRIEK